MICSQQTFRDDVLEAVGKLFGIEPDGDLPPAPADMPAVARQVLERYALGTVSAQSLLSWCGKSATQKALGESVGL